MFIPSSHVPRFIEKRQTETSHQSNSLIPHVDNKVGLIVGVGLAAAAILALLVGGLIKRYSLRRSRLKSESSPGGVQTAARQPPSSLSRPSNAESDRTESTLCAGPVGLTKELYDHFPRPPSVLAAPQTLIPPPGSRPPSALSVATISSQCTARTERSSGWESVGQRLDEKAGTTGSNRASTASTLPPLSPIPTSPRSPTSPSSPIRLPSPASLKDNKRHLYGGN